jgi:hypothetical protein
MSRILRDYNDAGGLNTLLAPWGFVADSTVLTKAGHVALAYKVHGVDVDGLTHDERHAVARRMEAALRVLDERCRVYQYLVKRTADRFVAPFCPEPVAQEAATRRAAYLNARRSELCRLELFLVLLYEPPRRARMATSLEGFWRTPRESLRAWLSTERTLQIVASELDAAVDALHHKVELFEAQLVDLGLTRLSRDGTFRFLRRLVNYDPAVVDATRATAPDTHLDFFVGDSPVECHRDHLIVGRRTVKVLSMKEPPSQTFAHLLGELFAVPGEFVACFEWQRISADRMRRDIQSRRRHFFNKRVSLVNYITPGEARTEDMLIDVCGWSTARRSRREDRNSLSSSEKSESWFGRSRMVCQRHPSRRSFSHSKQDRPSCSRSSRRRKCRSCCILEWPTSTAKKSPRYARRSNTRTADSEQRTRFAS